MQRHSRQGRGVTNSCTAGVILNYQKFRLRSTHSHPFLVGTCCSKMYIKILMTPPLPLPFRRTYQGWIPHHDIFTSLYITTSSSRRQRIRTPVRRHRSMLPIFNLAITILWGFNIYRAILLLKILYSTVKIYLTL